MDNKKEPIYGKWWFWFIAIIMIIVVLATPKNNNTEDSTPNNDQQAQQTQEAPQKNDDGSLNYTDSGVQKDDLITYCQEKYLILKNLVPRGVSLIYVWDYKPKMWDTGGYTQDGDQIMMLKWNGKDKNADKVVDFTCYISAKSKDDITVHQVLMNGKVLDGILIEYKKDGTLFE